MKKLFKKVTILSLIIFAFSCSKDDEKVTESNDCVVKNYGVIAVKYINLSAKHTIDITENGTSGISRSKITATGIANDTVHLKPGSYNISISRINNAGQSLEDHPVVNSLLNQCGNQTINTQI